MQDSIEERISTENAILSLEESGLKMHMDLLKRYKTAIKELSEESTVCKLDVYRNVIFLSSKLEIEDRVDSIAIEIEKMFCIKAKKVIETLNKISKFDIYKIPADCARINQTEVLRESELDKIYKANIKLSAQQADTLYNEVSKCFGQDIRITENRYSLLTYLRILSEGTINLLEESDHDFDLELNFGDLIEKCFKDADELEQVTIEENVFQPVLEILDQIEGLRSRVNVLDTQSKKLPLNSEITTFTDKLNSTAKDIVDLEEKSNKVIEEEDIESIDDITSKFSRILDSIISLERDFKNFESKYGYREPRTNTVGNNLKIFSKITNFLAQNRGQEYKQTDSWLKLNNKFVGTDIILPGRRREPVPVLSVPSIGIFFDRSLSWGTSERRNLGKRILNKLKELEDSRKIKLKIIYFDDKIISTGPSEPTQINVKNRGKSFDFILQYCQENRLENAVIITDGDLSEGSSTLQLEGQVWYVFVDTISKNFSRSLTGRLGTTIEYLNSNSGNSEILSTY